MTTAEQALAAIVEALRRSPHAFALVGGLAVSVRAEVRFTNDVDLAVAVNSDKEAEALVQALIGSGYRTAAIVEHETTGRLAAARLISTHGVRVDLLFASSGIESELVGSAIPTDLGSVGSVPVARAEELLSMKILSMTDRRLQDSIDATNLLAFNPSLDLSKVRENLRLIEERGYARNQDLEAKLTSLLATRA